MSRYQSLLRRNRLLRQQLRQQQRLIKRIASAVNTTDTNDIVIYGGTTAVTTTVQQVAPVYVETYVSPPPAPVHDLPWDQDCDDDYSHHRTKHHFDD